MPNHWFERGNFAIAVEDLLKSPLIEVRVAKILSDHEFVSLNADSQRKMQLYKCFKYSLDSFRAISLS